MRKRLHKSKTVTKTAQKSNMGKRTLHGFFMKRVHNLIDALAKAVDVHLEGPFQHTMGKSGAKRCSGWKGRLCLGWIQYSPAVVHVNAFAAAGCTGQRKAAWQEGARRICNGRRFNGDSHWVPIYWHSDPCKTYTMTS